MNRCPQLNEARANEELKRWYKEKKAEIEARLEEFKKKFNGSEEEIFAELCFCLCTPQTSARAADVAVRRLVESGLLVAGSKYEIERKLRKSGVRFSGNKATYIVEAKRFFSSRQSFSDDVELSIKERLPRDPRTAREYLRKNIKGLGMKEASHFLRNVGYSGLAILDRHILRTLNEAGIISEVPKSLTRRRYLQIEQSFLDYARRLQIPPDALDLVMWSAKTGEIFK